MPKKVDTSWITDDLLDALAFTESGMNPNAVSPSGAAGMYQWMPAYYKEGKAIGFGVPAGKFDPKDPVESRKRTKAYLEGLQKHYPDWDASEVLMAYNWGHGNVKKLKSGELNLEDYMAKSKWNANKVKEAMNYAPKVFKHLQTMPWVQSLDNTAFKSTL